MGQETWEIILYRLRTYGNKHCLLNGPSDLILHMNKWHATCHWWQFRMHFFFQLYVKGCSVSRIQRKITKFRLGIFSKYFLYRTAFVNCTVCSLHVSLYGGSCFSPDQNFKNHPILFLYIYMMKKFKKYLNITHLAMVRFSYMHEWVINFHQKVINLILTGGNWQKWKRVFLTCPCHEIYRDEAVGLKSCKNTWKITIFVKMWNLGQYRENLIFCQ